MGKRRRQIKVEGRTIFASLNKCLFWSSKLLHRRESRKLIMIMLVVVLMRMIVKMRLADAHLPVWL